MSDIEDHGRHCPLMSQTDFECNPDSVSLSDVSTGDLVRELEKRDEVEVYSLPDSDTHCSIHYEHEYDPKIILSKYPEGPAKILVNPAGE